MGDVTFALINAKKVAFYHRRRHNRCSAAVERIKHQIALVRASPDDSIEHANRHLTAVPTLALLERPAYAAFIPSVADGIKEFRKRGLACLPPLLNEIAVAGLDVIGLLRAEEPHIIRQLALGVGALVGIGRLPGAGDADVIRVEGETLFFLREI